MLESANPPGASIAFPRDRLKPTAKPAATGLANHATAHDETAATIPMQTAAATAAPSNSDSDTARKESARARIQERLLTDLRRNFEYPLVARRNGWEGTVWLTFRVQSSGVLDDVRVARGSGYDVLDSSALDTIRRIGRVPESKPRPGGETLDMRLPIVYRLVDR